MPPAKPALAPLTSVRFLASLRVALTHFVVWDDKTSWWRGLMGAPVSVSYFFVSSGFLLTYNYADRADRGEMNYRTFLLGRCARLLPVYYLGLLVAIPSLFWPIWSFSPGKVVKTLLLLQAWSPNTALYWNLPAWALSNLAFFYVCLPGLLYLTRGLSKRACLSLIGLAWAAGLGVSVVYTRWNPDGLHEMNSQSAAYWLYVLKYHPLARIPEFLMGVVTGRLFLLTGGFRPKTSTVVFLSTCAVLTAALLLGYRIPYVVLNSGLLAPLLALLVSSLASGGLGARLLRPKWFVFLGQCSFCLYMIHWPIWDFVHQVFAANGELSHLANRVLGLGIIALAILLYKWVEVPATTTLRNLLLAPQPAPPAPVPATSD